MKRTVFCLLLAVMANTLTASDIPTAYLDDIRAEKIHMFNRNQIKSFVYNLFSLFDKHADINEIYPLLDKNNLTMIFPEIEVKNLFDFKKWYDGIGKNIKNNLHFVKKLEVSFLENHKYQVNITVNWQAVDKDDKFINAMAVQKWVLADNADNKEHPLIQQYIVGSFTPVKAVDKTISVTFISSNNRKVYVQFFDGKEPAKAKATLWNGKVIDLIHAISASGVRFINKDYEFWNKGDSLRISKSGKIIFEGKEEFLDK